MRIVGDRRATRPCTGSRGLVVVGTVVRTRRDRNGDRDQRRATHLQRVRTTEQVGISHAVIGRVYRVAHTGNAVDHKARGARECRGHIVGDLKVRKRHGAEVGGQHIVGQREGAVAVVDRSGADTLGRANGRRRHRGLSLIIFARLVVARRGIRIGEVRGSHFGDIRVVTARQHQRLNLQGFRGAVGQRTDGPDAGRIVVSTNAWRGRHKRQPAWQRVRHRNAGGTQRAVIGDRHGERHGVTHQRLGVINYFGQRQIRKHGGRDANTCLIVFGRVVVTRC